MSIVKRADRLHYLNTGTESEPIWSQIGEGFTEFKESKNAISYQRRYIHEKTKRTDITGYAPVIDYEFEVYSSNPAIDKIRMISDRELLGDSAKIEILTVDMFDETAVAGCFAAMLRKYSVIPDECGEGTDVLCYTGTMKASGDAVLGKFNAATKVFTANN